MRIAKTGYDEKTGLYKSRYYAAKAALAYQVIVKVDGGYRIMEPYEYHVWKNQR